MNDEREKDDVEVICSAAGLLLPGHAFLSEAEFSMRTAAAGLRSQARL